MTNFNENPLAAIYEQNNAILSHLQKLERLENDSKTTKTEANQQKEYLTKNEVAELLKVNPITVSRWVNREMIKAYTVGGQPRFLKNEIEVFLRPYIPIKRKRA